MSRRPKEFAVLAVSARTGNGDEVCRVGSQDVALSISAKLRYLDVREVDPKDPKRAKRVRKYESVTTMKVFADGTMEPVVVR